MPFKDYKNSPLLSWLVPIIPKGAKLSPKSSLTPERIGKIPGRWTDEGWVGFEGFTKHRTTAKLCDAFDAYFKDRSIKIDGKEYLIMEESQILGILE